MEYLGSNPLMASELTLWPADLTVYSSIAHARILEEVTQQAQGQRRRNNDEINNDDDEWH